MRIILHTLHLAVSATLISCSSVSSTPPRSGNQSHFASPVGKPASSGISPQAKRKIGQKIWQNESGGKISGLTHWNVGEEFPSIGIGHFIWYPAGFNGRWTESFPRFIQFAQQHHSQGIPPWVLQSKHCPWPNRNAFMKDFNGPRLTSLRNYLSKNVALQTDFIIATSRQALPNMLAAAPASQRQKIQTNYHLVSTTPQGTYALIDYVNFKGDGTNPREQYKHQGWGLMWVLMEMKPVSAGAPAAREFAAAAKRCLDRRIKNSPPARGEARWRQGWHNRCDTYARPL